MSVTMRILTGMRCWHDCEICGKAWGTESAHYLEYGDDPHMRLVCLCDDCFAAGPEAWAAGLRRNAESTLAWASQQAANYNAMAKEAQYMRPEFFQVADIARKP